MTGDLLWPYSPRPMTWPRSKPYRSGRGACPNRPTHQAVARDGLLDAVLVLRPTEAAGAPPAAARRRGRTAILAEGYGLSEASCASARSFPEAPRPHSVGQCPPYQQMRVVRAGADGTWEDVPAGGRVACWGSAALPSSGVTSPAAARTATSSGAAGSIARGRVSRPVICSTIRRSLPPQVAGS